MLNERFDRMRRIKDITGQRFGKLVALEFVGRENKQSLWRCKCDCGNIRITTQGKLCSGNIKSCGCLYKATEFKDITGQRFGKLVAMEYVGKQGKRSMWKCKCDCGNTHIASQANLHSGNIKSCGCLCGRGAIKDITGQRFGKLVALEYIGRKNKQSMWRCKCDCGNTHNVSLENLQGGHVRSCGCITKQAGGDAIKRTRLYYIWANIRGRCGLKKGRKDSELKVYAERGITLCKEWAESYLSFKEWALANGYKRDLTIDRIDNDKGYSPDNCRWVTQKENCRNTSKNLRFKDGTVFIQFLEDVGIQTTHTVPTPIYQRIAREFRNGRIHEELQAYAAESGMLDKLKEIAGDMEWI